MAPSLGAAEFAQRMAALGLEGAAPQLAVACSGGADSLALTFLAEEWARARGGSLVALIVDHRLRPESGAEAAMVAHWLEARGIAAKILTWRDGKPTSNVAAAARAARYRLLGDWCRRHGVSDLLLAHHLEDQAETFLLRLGRGSGVDGLSAMAPLSFLDSRPSLASRSSSAPVSAAGCKSPPVRLVRPLLDVPRDRLRSLLRQGGQLWVEDPSNQDPAYARTRVRALAPVLAAEGMTAHRLAATAARMRRVRTALEHAAEALRGDCAVRHPGGYAVLDLAALTAAPEELSLRVLAALLRDVGGQAAPPRLERLERLFAVLAAGDLGRGRTLMGCRLLPWRGQVAICREASAMAPPMVVPPGRGALWDGRFLVSAPLESRATPLRVGALGPAGWAAVRQALRRRGAAGEAVARRAGAMPGAARHALPALWDLDGVHAVPHLQYWPDGTKTAYKVCFRPLAPAGIDDAGGRSACFDEAEGDDLC